MLALAWISSGGASPGGTGATTEQPPQKADEVLKLRPGSLPAVEIHPARPPEPLVAPGPAPDVEILLTSAVQGFYQPCG
jgi:hypothetical protein